MERDESGRRLAVLSTQLDDARRTREEEKLNYTESLAELERSIKALARVQEDPRLAKPALLELKRRPDWEKELEGLDSLDTETPASSGPVDVLSLLKDVHTKLVAEKDDVLDR